MTNQLLIYRTAAPVSRMRHGGCAVQADGGYGFSRGINSVPVMSIEFPHVAGRYPVVFAGPPGQVLPAAMLGLQDGENLFVTPEGGWRGAEGRGGYVPAFLRRYPFVFSREAGQDGGDRFVLCVDEEYEGFRRDGVGQALFGPDGEPTAYVRQVLAFMQDFQAQFARTQAFCARLETLDLLEPMQAEITDPAGHRTSLRGFMAVGRARLKALPAPTLAELMAADEMELLFLHLQSMRNFQALQDMRASLRG